MKASVEFELLDTSRSDKARLDNGTRWSLPDFMRAPGTFQAFSRVSISARVVPIVSLVRAAVRIVNSRARAGRSGLLRSCAMNAAISEYGRAAWCCTG